MGGGSHRLPSLTYTVQREESLILNLLCNFGANHLRIRTRASAGAGLASAWVDRPPRGCGFVTRQVTRPCRPHLPAQPSPRTCP